MLAPVADGVVVADDPLLLDAQEHVHLVPQVPKGADYAIPSKIYAIMAAGRPFVCTTIPGSPLWSLAEQTRVPPHDPEAFASAVIRLIEDPERRRTMGLYGRRYVEARAERSLLLNSYAELIGGEDNGLYSQHRHQRSSVVSIDHEASNHGL